MKNYAVIASALALLGASACQQDNKELERKIDRLDQKMADLSDKLDKVGTAAAGAAAAGQRGGQGERKRRPEPNPNDVYAVPIDGDPSDGPADALVTIVKGYEYACPFCDKVRPTLEQIHKEYGDKVRVVYKQYVVHPQVATLPALAVCAAHQQGKFVEYDKLVWEKAYAANRDFSQANLEKLAGEAKLDLTKFKADMEGKCKEFIKKDQQDLQAVGQGATPTFYINGRYMSGAQQLATFKKVIDEEIKKAEERIASGTSASSYYKTWVLDKGLKKFEPPKDAPAVQIKQPQPKEPGAQPAPKADPAQPAGAQPKGDPAKAEGAAPAPH